MQFFKFNKMFAKVALLCLLFSACNRDQLREAQQPDLPGITPQSTEGEIIPNQYIVLFSTEKIAPAIHGLTPSDSRTRAEKSARMQVLGQEVKTRIDAFLERKSIDPASVLHYYTALQAGVALRLEDRDFEALSRSEEIASIEHDRVVTLPPFEVEEVVEAGARAQTTPCGISNAGGAAVAGTDRWIWVVDTGIDLDHPDLSVVTNTTYAKSFVGGSANDCQGHGTHVAGTAAAINNSIGVVGVAAGAPVVPVRVLDCSGSGSTSGIIAGLNHVAANDLAGDVVNLSLGGYYGSGCATYSSYRSVVQGLGSAGTRVAIAAGNSSGNATLYQPACVNGTNVFTVASMTCSGAWSSFSNYGRPPIDWIATGSSVYSTYLNGGYATLSGTSMATPHVAGIMQIRNGAPRNGGSVSYGGTSYPKAIR